MMLPEAFAVRLAVLAVNVVVVGVVVLAVGVGVRPLLRRLHPRAQGLAWWALLVAAVVAPFAARVAAPQRPPADAPRTVVSAATAPASLAPAPTPAEAGGGPTAMPSRTVGEGGAPAVREEGVPGQRLGEERAGVHFSAGAWVWGVAALWFAGAAVFLLRTAVGIWRVGRHKKKGASWAHPAVDVAWGAAGSGRRCSVLVSPAVSVPIAVGWFRPAILVPAFVVEHAPLPDLTRLLLHEIAHLRRWHDWAKLGQEVVGALLFFHPSLRWLTRELARSREEICDAWVVDRTGSARSYALTLARLGRLTRRLGPIQEARLGLPSSHLERRIAMLTQGLGAAPYRRVRALLGVAMAWVGVVAAVVALPTALVLADPAGTPAGGGPWRQVAGLPTEPYTFAVLSGHATIPAGLAFSPRGDVLATAEWGTGVVRLWDLDTMQEVRTLLRLEEMGTRVLLGRGPRSPLAFSPDGRLVAAAGTVPSRYASRLDAVVRVWDVDRGEVVAEFFTGEFMFDVAFSPDGEHVAVAGEGEAAVWSVEEQAEVWRIPDGRSFERVAWSPDRRWLALGAVDPVEGAVLDITLWDVATRERVAVWGGAGPEVAFSPGGEYLAFSAQGGEVWVVALASGEIVLRLPAHPEGPVTFMPDGTLIARTPDGALRAWTVPGGHLVWELPGAGQHRLAVHPSGRIVATATGFDLTVRLWDVGQGRPVAALPGLRARGCLAVSPSSGRIAFADGADVTVWEEPYGGPVHTLPHRGYVTALGWDASGATLAVGVRGEIHVWEVATTERVILPGHRGEALAVAFSPDGQVLASGGGDGTVRLWDLRTGEERAVLPAPREKVNAVAFSPDGRTLAAASHVAGWSPVLTLWDVATGEKRAELPERGMWVAFRPDGTLVALRASVAPRSVDIVILDPETGEEKQAVEGGWWGWDALALDPTGRYLAMGGPSLYPWLRVWDVVEGKVVAEVPTGAVAAAAFGPGGRLFISGRGQFPSLGALVAFYLGREMTP